MDEGAATRPVEPLPADAGTAVATEPEPDAGTARETVTPSVPAAGAAAPSSKPDAGPAAPSSKPDAGTPPAAGSPATPADAGSGALTEGENTGTGKGGVSQSDGKLAAFIEINDVPSGAEAHRCVLVELPNTEPVWVSALHASLGNGSHHMIVDRPGAEVELIPNAELCSPTMGGDVSRLLIAQQHETRLDLPDGVGFLLEPKQRIFLQLHYVNTTSKPFAIKGTIELELFPKDVRPIEAKSVFTGSTSITLPPRQPGESKHFQVLPADPAWNVFAMTSHTHQLGVHSTIERVASATAPTVTPLHESRDWAEPPLTVFKEPLVFDGTDGLRLTCRYMNTTDRDVRFGTGVNDEMCFMWLYYFENGQR
jgi:hypothetical protein